MAVSGLRWAGLATLSHRATLPVLDVMPSSVMPFLLSVAVLTITPRMFLHHCVTG